MTIHLKITPHPKPLEVRIPCSDVLFASFRYIGWAAPARFGLILNKDSVSLLKGMEAAFYGMSFTDSANCIQTIIKEIQRYGEIKLELIEC